MEYDKLHEALKSLNGLHDDLDKRIKIITSIEETSQIAIFAYGSLLWNPIDYVDEKIFDCNLYGYKKGFICEDFIYRGTTDFTGLTMGLQRNLNGCVNGVLLIGNSQQSLSFIEAFAKRETPVSINGVVMDIYTYDFLEVTIPNSSKSQYALACVANTKSKFYVDKPMTLEQQAWKMARAYGQNGTNLQYLRNTIDMYRKFNLKDTYISEMDDLYKKVLSYCQNLSTNDQQWLAAYDELTTLEERQKVAQSPNSVRYETSVQPYSIRRQISLGQRIFVFFCTVLYFFS